MADSVIDGTEAEQAVGEKSGAGQTQTRERRTVKVGSLKPNPVNSATFTESLGDESIQALAENIERNRGLRQPIEIRPDGTILDGERRWRAVQVLGWDEVDVVVVHEVEGDDAVEAYVFDAYDSIRDACVGEQVNVYRLALRVLKRRHGRSRGRPAKSGSNEPDILSRDEIRAEAAKRSGLGSPVTAMRAEKVFTEGDDDLRARVNSGEVSISAAYDAIKPKPKPKPKPKKNPAKAEKKLTSSPDAPEGDDTPADDRPETGTGDTPDDADSGGASGSSEPESEGETLDVLDDDSKEDTSGDDDDPGTSGGDNDPGTSGDDDPDTGGDDDEDDQDDEETGVETDADQVSDDDDPAETDDQDDEDASAETDDAEPLDPKAAVAVVRDLIRNKGAEVARKLLPVFAADAYLGCWIESEDPAVSLRRLSELVRDQIEKLAEADIDAAQGWVEGLCGELSELVAGYEPTEIE